NLTNGANPAQGASLLGALAWFGLDGLQAVEKDSMRRLAIRGGPYTNSERLDLLDYCESDVVALERLLNRMLPRLDTQRALLRGRYMIAAAKIEFQGVPIDLENLLILRPHWHEIEALLIREIDGDFGVFDGRTFKAERFAQYLSSAGIPWPLLPSGSLALDDETFCEMAPLYLVIAPILDFRLCRSPIPF